LYRAKLAVCGFAGSGRRYTDQYLSIVPLIQTRARAIVRVDAVARIAGAAASAVSWWRGPRAMTFRARLFIAFAATAVIPLAVLAAGIAHELDRRLTDADRRRVGCSPRR